MKSSGSFFGSEKQFRSDGGFVRPAWQLPLSQKNTGPSSERSFDFLAYIPGTSSAMMT
jgi:hypothetical protein